MQFEIGLLHRGTEKLIEYRNYNLSIPYFNRLDYVSYFAQEEIYCFGIEKVLNITVSKYHSIIRTILIELSRLLNHLLAITTHALDVGGITPFLYAFEEREKLLNIMEVVCGARFHSAYNTVGGVLYDINVTTFNYIGCGERVLQQTWFLSNV